MENMLENPSFKPLYAQLKTRFIRRIVEGTWAGGMMLPSEMDLAKELNVSQGTVRKALDEMTAENLLIRRQGVGTFVAKHDEERILFQFFKLQPNNGARAFPESIIISASSGITSVEEQKALNLTHKDQVLRIQRIRVINGTKALVEEIILPASLYPELEKNAIPNNLYGLYAAHYGIVIGHASERIKAIAAPELIANLLGCEIGIPLLKIDRVAITVDGRIAEWRISYCLSDEFYYASELK
jgi:GntR family transcriptional regulator